MIPLSAINHFLFCPRRAALIHLEGIFEDNQHTLRGDIVHEHSDLAGYEVAKGVLLWRALPVFSEHLGLNGKCDIVEVHPGSAPPSAQADQLIPDERALNPQSAIRSPQSFLPVEFKLGKRRKWQNDDVQLCAQAFCLEEMFGVPVPRGAVFHADSKRRRPVEFTPELRSLTAQAIDDLHRLLDFHSDGTACRVPPAVLKPACEECSLFDICLPQATGSEGRASRLASSLFRI